MDSYCTHKNDFEETIRASSPYDSADLYIFNIAIEYQRENKYFQKPFWSAFIYSIYSSLLAVLYLYSVLGFYNIYN